MVQVLGQLLPLALVVALSTVPLLVVITILLAPGSAASSLTFLIGWPIGMLAAVALFYLGANLIPGPFLLRNRPVLGWAEIVLGLLVVIIGIVQFRRTRGRSPKPPAWIGSVGRVRPAAAFGIAIALCFRPKALLLSSAAAIIIGASRVEGIGALVVILIFVALSASSVVVPIIAMRLRPDAMRRPLQSAEAWIVRNSRAVTLVAASFAGVFIIGHGMTQL